MPCDNADTIVDEDGRVKSHHIVMFDYNPGGGERAINSQAAPTTEASMVKIMMYESQRGLDMIRCGRTMRLNSDNCCADLKCADHFGALDSWVNPRPVPYVGNEIDAIDALKAKLGLEEIVRGHGAAEHGKFEGDQVATHHRNECDKLTLAWTPGEDVPNG
eukprot:COSAG02_NODE_27743_length_603_cov_1.204365_1_plen_160_part_10